MRRELVDGMQSHYRVGIKRGCKAVLIDRASYYYVPHRDEQHLLRMKIRDYEQSPLKYGYLHIHILPRREGLKISKDRVYRLYCIEGLNLRCKYGKKRVAAPFIEMPPESHPNESWAMDFVSERMFNGSGFGV